MRGANVRNRSVADKPLSALAQSGTNGGNWGCSRQTPSGVRQGWAERQKLGGKRTLMRRARACIFMTVAWNGHLKFRNMPMVTAVLSAGGSRWSNTPVRFQLDKTGSVGRTTGELSRMLTRRSSRYQKPSVNPARAAVLPPLLNPFATPALIATLSETIAPTWRAPA